MAVDYISAFPAPLWPTPAEELTVITRPFTVLAEACKVPAATVPGVYSFLNCLNTVHAPQAAFRPADPPLRHRTPDQHPAFDSAVTLRGKFQRRKGMDDLTPGMFAFCRWGRERVNIAFLSLCLSYIDESLE